MNLFVLVFLYVPFLMRVSSKEFALVTSGGTVELPCSNNYTDEFNGQLRFWLLPSLTELHRKNVENVTRFTIDHNNSLILTDANAKDAGTYICVLENVDNQTPYLISVEIPFIHEKENYGKQFGAGLGAAILFVILALTAYFVSEHNYEHRTETANPLPFNVEKHWDKYGKYLKASTLKVDRNVNPAPQPEGHTNGYSNEAIELEEQVEGNRRVEPETQTSEEEPQGITVMQLKPEDQLKLKQ